MNYQPNNPWTNPSSPYAYAHGNADGNAVMGTVQLLLAEPTQPTTRWTRVEENKLFLDLLYDNPEVDWKAISQQLPGHDADDCKMKRWTVIKRRCPDFRNNLALRPYDWTPREDDLLVDLYELGGDWDLIARQLRGRTREECRDRWLVYLQYEHPGVQEKVERLTALRQQ